MWSSKTFYVQNTVFVSKQIYLHLQDLRNINQLIILAIMKF